MTTTDQVVTRERALFKAVDLDGDGRVAPAELLAAFTRAGLTAGDPRLSECTRALDSLAPQSLDFDAFSAAVRPNILLVEKALQGMLVIPDFPAFADDLEAIFADALRDRSGSVADYIPQLGRVEPEQFGVAACTIDGQRWSKGQADVDFCVQSTCKPINYCLALEEHGEDTVHQYIGREPSGHGFNELRLNDHGKPHNPMINAGAIMACSLLRPELDIADRFDFLMDRWRALSGGTKPGFSNATYLSERATADRNFALGYYMQERRAFPKGTNLVETLEFYFQCCSIEATCQTMSVVAATLANGGVCPITGERVLSPRTVQNCLSLMSSCGMYDFSGEFAFTIGLPAKSGVAGAVMVVVPNVLGIVVWSPRLDRLGNSVRGIEFCRGLVQRFNFHNYDSLTGLSEKRDPRRSRAQTATDELTALIWAASKGDVTAVQQYAARRVNLDAADYDGRTPLHLAASEGHEAVVRYLVGHGVQRSPVDRWGNTPLDDARRAGHTAVVRALGGDVAPEPSEPAPRKSKSVPAQA
jgi:glutaminase